MLRKLFQNPLQYLLFSTMTMLSAPAFSQSVEVILSKEDVSQQSLAHKTVDCYKIALKNKSSKPVGLAGQNYRLYYNSDAVMLEDASIKSQLPASYTPMKLVQHTFDADATGFGVLPFESHLGFINLANDYNLSSAAPVTIGVGETADIADLCFNVTDASQDSGLTWAREDLTQSYATAFVEIARVEGNKLKKMKIDGLTVLGTRSSIWQEGSVVSMEYFPNPFRDQLEIKLNHALEANAEMDVLDVFGRLIQTQELKKGTDHISLKGDKFPAGALLIKIRQGNGDIATFKAIKTQ